VLVVFVSCQATNPQTKATRLQLYPADNFPVRAQDDADALGDDDPAIQPFHPDFTYPIFGEQEKIFGYKGLDVQVS
jgi:hypothetical protein